MIRKYLYKIVMRHVMKTVVLEDLKKTFAAEDRAKKIRMVEDAIVFKKSDLWPWLLEETTKEIQKKMYLESKTQMQLDVNKMGLWVVMMGAALCYTRRLTDTEIGQITGFYSYV